MDHKFLTAACMGLMLSMMAPVAGAADFDVKRQTASGVLSTSVGHNLQSRMAAMSAEDSGRVKALPSKKNLLYKAPTGSRGISATSRRSQLRTNEIAETSALMFESFESCTHLSDAMPQGWTTQSKGQKPLGAEDRWIGISKGYAEYNMFALPAHGQMMCGMFYNDDDFKDEWLVSPSVFIPEQGYELSFYWYTLPYYMYVIDRFHVDFDKKVFTDREVLFDVDVMVRPEGGEWTKVFHLEQLFSDLEYYILEDLDFATMQKTTLDLNDFAGKTVQVAFRYWGEGGNSYFMDAVRIDRPLPDVSFEPDPSRLFYGYSPDEALWWMDASIEFYPVEHPVSWYNSSDKISGCDFNWKYCNLGENGALDWFVSDDARQLDVTYHPDYSSDAALMNNFYFLPTLKGRNALGGISDEIAGSSDFLQAGGTTEFIDYSGEEPVYTKYVALDFDIINEGFGMHLEEDETLGFLAEPIFGRSVNTDAWWKHYCFPDNEEEGQYAYVDGFANLFMPHATAPLVVNGVSAAAIGRIYPEAEFTMKVYTMDEEGNIIETPLATKTIRGSDVIKVDAYSTSGDFLVLNFPLDQPLVFDTAGTGYGYVVEVSGYHDDKIEYFCPLQSTVPNEYEWCFGFYHLYSSLDEKYGLDFTQQFGYVAFFKDFRGRDLFTSFAIGLDAHYPWLKLGSEFDCQPGSTGFTLHSYFGPENITVEAPEGVSVKLSGERYRTAVTVTAANVAAEFTAPITFATPGATLTVDVPVKAESGIGSVAADSATAPFDVYNAQGMLLLRGATDADLQRLPPGLYIANGRKYLRR